jgi:hypothetical protein
LLMYLHKRLVRPGLELPGESANMYSSAALNEGCQYSDA